MQTVVNMENTLQKHKSNMTPWTTTSFDYKLGSFNSKVRTVEDVKKNSHIGGNTPMSPKKFRQDKSLFTHINTSHHEMEEYLQRQGFVFEEEKERVTVSLKNSEKLNIKVTLDSNLDICHASYKAFRWFAANIISAKSETSSPLDCVCYLTSKSMLSEDDYKELSKYKLIESIDNKVKVNPKFDSHVKFVRRIRTRKYTRIDKDTNLKVKAYLMKVEYSKQFKSLFPSQSHVEFKLKFPDPKPTSEYLQFFWKESLRFWTYFHHSF